MKRYWILGLLAAIVVPVAAHGGTEEGAASVVPWSGYWWPLQRGELLGPLGKYDQLTGAHAADWERAHKAPGAGQEAWAGYCHAWSASSIIEKEPNQPLPVQAMVLGVGDQKGLLAAAHAHDVANIFGDRCGDGQGDDPQDIYPDVLWNNLKLYIRQQGVPLILDLEAGPEVWNYPVYAYRVDWQPTGNGDEQLATLHLWAADDGVPADYVGTSVHYQTYQFTFRMRNGSVLAGSARWVGASQQNHPDFAWHPYVVVPENPEVSYEKVCQLLGTTPQDPTQPRPQDPNPPTPPVDPQPPVAPPVTPPGSLPGQPPLAGTTPASFPVDTRPVCVSPSQLMALIANKSSSFGFDANIDKSDGGQYTVGEPLKVLINSAQAGYLTVLYLDTHGGLTLLCPPPEALVTVAAQQAHVLGPYVTAGPPGVHRIKAIVTQRPLVLTGATSDPGDQDSTKGLFGRRRKFIFCPTQQQQVQQFLVQYQQQTPKSPAADPKGKIEDLIGPFAQDEVAFYVGPAEDQGKK